MLLIGMALLRDQSITAVADKLEIARPGKGVIAASSLAEARARLGASPLEWLFITCSEQWATRSARSCAWRGRSVYGVDGTTLRVADSTENRAHFGGTSNERRVSGYPLLRCVALMVLRSHVIAAASFGPYARGEHDYAQQLWCKVPDDSLVIVDKGFFSASVLMPLARDGTNRHWLIRAKKALKHRVVAKLGPKDLIVELDVSRAARKQDPSLPTTWTCRLVGYQRRGFRPEWLLTSMIDAERYPREEVIALYHERWELELGFDEIKTHLLDSLPTLRSQRRALVEQELLGILIAYNLVRAEIERAAALLGVPPLRISFTNALMMIVDALQSCWSRTPGAIPPYLRLIERRMARLVLPPRRDRSFPRAVKINMSNYARKRPPTRKAR